MTSRSVTGLGLAQCVYWGVLYYAFAIVVLPVARELRQPAWVVTGAFSLALLICAAAAPIVGRWGDRGRGATAMQIGGSGAAVLLVAWTLVPGVLWLYIVWAGLGLCMAATLYESAFVVVGRAFADPVQRLRALAQITLLGGLASTVFLPLTAWLVEAFDWRRAVLALAVAVAAATWLTRVSVLQRLPPPRPAPPSPSGACESDDANAGLIGLAAALFAAASLAGGALATNLVPVLSERGLSPASAAALGGLLGIMQLPGRALLMRGAMGATPTQLVTLSLTLQAAGLFAVALLPSPFAIGLGIAIFAMGGGVVTLVRPHVIRALATGNAVGYVNGRVARHQQIARAVGPVALAGAAPFVGYATAIALLGFTLAAGALVAPGIIGRNCNPTLKRSEA